MSLLLVLLLVNFSRSYIQDMRNKQEKVSVLNFSHALSPFSIYRRFHLHIFLRGSRVFCLGSFQST